MAKATPNLRKLPPDLVEALEASGKVLTVELGRRHQKLKVDGKLVGILRLSDTTLDERNGGTRKIIAQIRREISG